MRQLWIGVVLVLMALLVTAAANAGPVWANVNSMSARAAPVAVVGTYSSTKTVVHSGIGTMSPTTEVAVAPVAPVPVSRSGTQLAATSTPTYTAANKGSPSAAMATTALSPYRQSRGAPSIVVVSFHQSMDCGYVFDLTHSPPAAMATRATLHHNPSSMDGRTCAAVKSSLSASPVAVASMTRGAEGKMDETSERLTLVTF